MGVRYGGRIGAGGYYRAFMKAFDISESSSGTNDDWKMLRAGFRAEWMPRLGAMNVQGGVYKGQSAENTDVPTLAFPRGGMRRLSRDVTGHDVLFR